MKSEELIREGKTKKLHSWPEDDTFVVMEFLDRITAGDGKLTDYPEGKGKIAREITEILFTMLEYNGVPTHFIRSLGENRMLVRNLEMLPFEAVIRFQVAGSFLRRYPVEKGAVLPGLVEFFLKDDERHDPLLSEEALFFLFPKAERLLPAIREHTRKTGNVFKKVFAKIGLNFIDLKLEFGLDKEGKLFVGDEISPDSFRLWNEAGESFDKDVYRKYLNDVEHKETDLVLAKYKEVLKRLREEGPHG